MYHPFVFVIFLTCLSSFFRTLQTVVSLSIKDLHPVSFMVVNSYFHSFSLQNNINQQVINLHWQNYSCANFVMLTLVLANRNPSLEGARWNGVVYLFIYFFLSVFCLLVFPDLVCLHELYILFEMIWITVNLFSIPCLQKETSLFYLVISILTMMVLALFYIIYFLYQRFVLILKELILAAHQILVGIANIGHKTVAERWRELFKIWNVFLRLRASQSHYKVSENSVGGTNRLRSLIIIRTFSEEMNFRNNC